MPFLYLPLLVLVIAAFAGHWVSGAEDCWAHAAVGRWIWEHRQVPRHTLFLWTVSNSEPWVAHAWLSQLMTYGILQTGGTALVRVLTVLLAALPFILLWWCWSRESRVHSLTAVLFWIGILASAIRFSARPELVTALFLTLLLVFLMRWSARPTLPPSLVRGGILPAMGLLLLFTVWVNSHGMVLLGLALLGLTASCDLLQDRFSGRSRGLLLLTLPAGAALLLNPYGMGYWKALQGLQGETFRRINEWRPFWQSPPLQAVTLVEILVLTMVAFLVWALNPGRRWSHLGWLLVVGGSFCKARRFHGLLALVDLAVLAANSRRLDPNFLWQAFQRRHRPDKVSGDLPLSPRQRGLVHGGLVLWLLISAWGAIPPPPGDMAPVPEAPVRFILDHRIPGNFFNDFGNSSYLDWRCGGSPPLYIDVLNAYPDQIFLNWLEIVNVTPRGRDLLKQQHIGYILLTRPRSGEELKKLADYLDGNPEWVKVYVGREGRLWVRHTPEYEYLWASQEDSRSWNKVP
ncbi:MAG: hypothetical protein JO112_09675 [Planctomycetes bacterium]|nr:hypothetical protein [Planctomycetota bacterium]